MNIKQIKNTISMLESPDKENHLVGLKVLENIDYKENLVVLLLCYKFGNPKEAGWIDDAPKAFKYMKGKVKLNKQHTFTYKDIFTAIVKTKAAVGQMDLFLDYFSLYLSEQCKVLGYDFIGEIEMKVKAKKK